MNSRIGWAAPILLLTFGTFCSLASANTITIGTSTYPNLAPFSTTAYIGEYQQVYNGALLSGPVDITGITFFAADLGAAISGDFTIDLSTTSVGVNSISTIYANNIGANEALFFSGSVSNVLSFNGGPFLYDPSQGNLLLDVNVITPNPAQPIRSLAAGCSSDTNRVYNLSGNGAPAVGVDMMGVSPLCTPNSYGLETAFTFTPVSTTPEPSVLLMLALGLIALVGATRLRVFGGQN